MNRVTRGSIARKFVPPDQTGQIIAVAIDGDEVARFSTAASCGVTVPGKENQSAVVLMQSGYSLIPMTSAQLLSYFGD